MIVGRVTASHEAVISLYVENPGGRRYHIDAVVDTGFSGFLTLPASLVRELGLVWRPRGRAMLADGSESLFDTYEATVTWHDGSTRIAVEQVDCGPLVGMALLYGCELTIQAVDGGRVFIVAWHPRNPGPPHPPSRT